MRETRVLRVAIASWLFCGAALAQGASEVLPRPATTPSGPAVPGEPGVSPGSTGLEAGGVEKGGGPPSPPPATAAASAGEQEGGEAPRRRRESASGEARAPTKPSETLAAPDTLQGHFVLSLGGSVAAPFGKLSSDMGQQQVLALGPAGTLELGFGVGRTVVVGAWGQAVRFGSGHLCDGTPATEADCSTTSFAGGPLVRYHLVQGVRFDPWLSAGVGVRHTSIDADGDFSYFGYDVLRLAFGGDWYALRNVGLGSWLELDGSVYTKRADVAPTGKQTGEEDAALALNLLVGVRLTLDIPGK